MKSLIKLIHGAWGWAGADPEEIVATNAFGNIIFRDNQGRYWRLCPEDVYCEIVADSLEDYEKLLRDEEFIEDWEMEALVKTAYRVVGSLEPGRAYCLKIPGILGGAYDETNVASAPISELVSFSGDLAYQIKDLPDGAQIKLEVGE